MTYRLAAAHSLLMSLSTQHQYNAVEYRYCGGYLHHIATTASFCQYWASDDTRADCATLRQAPARTIEECNYLLTYLSVIYHITLINMIQFLHMKRYGDILTETPIPAKIAIIDQNCIWIWDL